MTSIFSSRVCLWLLWFLLYAVALRWRQRHTLFILLFYQTKIRDIDTIYLSKLVCQPRWYTKDIIRLQKIRLREKLIPHVFFWWHPNPIYTTPPSLLLWNPWLLSQIYGSCCHLPKDLHLLPSSSNVAKVDQPHMDLYISLTFDFWVFEGNHW